MSTEQHDTEEARQQRQLAEAHAIQEFGTDGRLAFETRNPYAGVRIHEVAEILGHSSPQLMIRLYGHALPEEVSLAGVVLDAWRSQDPVDTSPVTSGSPLPISGLMPRGMPRWHPKGARVQELD